MRADPLEPEEFELVVKLWALGLSARSIGHFVRRTETSIVNLAGKPQNKRLFPRRMASYTPKDRQEIARLYAAGMSGSRIARLTGLDLKTVYLAVRKSGIEVRSRSCFLYPKRVAPSIIARHLMDGLTYTQIAKVLGKKRRSIEDAASRWKINRNATFEVRALPPRAIAEYLEALDDIRCHEDALEVALEYASIDSAAE